MKRYILASIAIAIVLLPLALGVALHIGRTIVDQISSRFNLFDENFERQSFSYTIDSKLFCQSDIGRYNIEFKIDKDNSSGLIGNLDVRFFNSATQKYYPMSCEPSYMCRYDEIFSIECDRLKEVYFLVEILDLSNSAVLKSIPIRPLNHSILTTAPF